MRSKFVFSVLLVLLIDYGFLAVAAACSQAQEEDVRGAFLTTRPKPAEKSATSGATGKPSRRRPKATQTKLSTSTSASATTGTKTSEEVPVKMNAGAAMKTSDSAPPKTSDAVSSKMSGQKIGLGLTLFTRDSNGLAVRVDPTHVFRKGDRVRVLLETNTEGYLYIFNTTDGGKPVMIYPNAELDEGGNYVQPHVPFEIPSSAAEAERLRWLTFDEYAGAERLFFVFTREPLRGVPTEEDLIKYCKEGTHMCPWQPASELWARVQAELSAPLKVAKAEKFGKAQTAIEIEATTRGLGLSKGDPEPSLVMMTASSNTSMLVALLELIHK